ncbi:MAG: hypothetical protein NC305_14715 [Lachnospiraceae bacterium]|nr:hypothetical protein [Butyrivibrio sp.]MCM1344855.1 hypothetical protein [Muribaculaceae bacterium]MCM1411780.1 hypothetical protein [Lachnospiraceae bacterium]
MSSNRKKQNRPRTARQAAGPETGTQAAQQAAQGGRDTGMECPAWLDREIHTDRLTSGQPYQRPVNHREVDRLIREWDERLLDPITVSFRDGKFYVVDGQHRIAAMRKMNGGSGVMVNCRVYSGLTYEQEAALCYKLDKAKKRLSLSQATNALAESGTDPETSEIKELVENCGFVWALGKSKGKTGEIVTTRALVNAYRLLGGAAFTRMLQLLWDAWEGDPRSLTASVLSGMALFVKTYETEMNDSTFVKRLSRADPDEINRRGRADFSTNNTALRFARVILEKYNGQRGGRKLPYRFRG